VGGEALRRVAEEEGDRRAQGRHLREREVDEDHVAREHLQAEVRVDPDEGRAGERREGQEGEGVAHRGPGRAKASASARTS
jgi:hypothetical protein